jgi:signal peptidase
MRVILTLLVVFVVSTIAYTFAPAGIGGLSTYASTAGTSMAPDFETGDLVILKKGGPLRVGDIGGYRSGLTGQIVVHRVIAEEHGRLTFQGDNNWWIDTYQPTQDEVVGKLWIHIGGAGQKLSAVHPAWILGGLGGVLGMTFMDTGSSSPSRRRRAIPERGNPFTGERVLGVLLALLVVTGVGGAATLVAFRTATTQPAERVITAQHTGVFSYEGPAPTSPVYDQGRVLTGDPILTDLLETITASFAYELDAPQATEVHGTIRLAAVIRDVNGWERTLDMVPVAEFTGNRAVASAAFPVGDITTFITGIQEAMGTGVRYWTIAVTGDVRISGVMDGQAFESKFHPHYTLRVVPPNEIYLETAETRDFESVPPINEAPLGSAFLPIEELTVSVPAEAPASMSLLVVDVGVDRLRKLAGSLTAVGAAATLFVALLFAWGQRSPSARFAARYGDKLVRVSEMNTDGDVVSLSTMQDLVRVADKYQSVIFWKRDGEDDTFVVQEDEARYIYRATVPVNS